jgi:hypothetical protein
VTDDSDYMTCAVCGMDYLTPEGMLIPRLRVGIDTETRHDVLACTDCCGESRQPKIIKPSGNRFHWLA